MGKRILFRIGDVLPADKAVARFVTRLCIVANDVALTQENTGIEYSKGDDHRRGVPLHYLWSAAAYLREAAKVLDEGLSNHEVVAFLGSLRPDVQERLERLRASFLPWDTSFVAETLKPLRDRTFHYPSDTQAAALLEAVQDLRSGVNLQSGKVGEIRFDFADEVVTNRVALVLGNDKGAQEASLRRIAELMLDLLGLAHAAVTQWLDGRSASAMEFVDEPSPEFNPLEATPAWGHEEAELLSALGALTVNFAALEEALHDALYLLAGNGGPVASVLTAGLSFRVLVDKFGALCKENGAARVSREEVLAFCAALNTLAAERNTYVHSAWNWHRDEKNVRRFKRTATVKKGFSLNVSDIQPGEVLALAKRMADAERKIWEIVP